MQKRNAFLSSGLLEKFYVLHDFTSLNAAATAGSLYVSKLAIEHFSGKKVL